MSDHDTIAAIATAPGQGGIGIIRISGDRAAVIAEQFLGTTPRPRYAHFTSFDDGDGDVIDEGILLFFSKPASFTAEDVVELQVHGGPAVLDRLLKRVLQMGCRQARAGEFSERAFLNDRIDLVQAEAIADLIAAESEQSARAAIHSLQGEFSLRIQKLLEELTALRMHVEATLDFPEEEIDFLADDAIRKKLDSVTENIRSIRDSTHQGRLLSEGLNVVITGRPNAGKSSLLNLLAGFDSAIVSDIPGTTRDVLREKITLDGVPLHVVDTAGLRDSQDAVEQEGVRRARSEIDKADIIIRVIDATENDTDEAFDGEILVYNKIDLLGKQPDREDRALWVSVKKNQGTDLLKQCILDVAGIGRGIQQEGSFTARRRHTQAIARVSDQLELADKALRNGDGEILAEELRVAQESLAEITGEFRADDLLGKIFSEFCIGK